ncbi:MAG TPA: PEGA domain-containing protein, partial [Polyangia bacterium]
AAEKMAVLILAAGPRDAELADNVTEMVIAAVARRGGVEVAGREEFRARLGDMSEARAQLCLEEIACVGRTAVSLGVRRIVTGTVGTRGPQFLFSLNLHDVEAGKVENRVFRLIEGTVNDLITAIETGSNELFRPKVEPGRVQITTSPPNARVSIDNAYLGVTPLLSGTLIPGAHRIRVEADGRFPWVSTVEVRSGKELGINLTESNLPRRRLWPGTAAYGAAGVSLAAAAAGGFLGVLSQVNPSGESRASAQRDLEQKQKLAAGATGAFITAGVAAAVSGALFVIYRDDIFGRREDAP